ncbi:UPF0389 protein CG9231-like [Limulus polyphemus]|uniref:UPF0389 protein CG9231-like n=1 Tax=Limulus polyphemus TaxID=6850 RepID=A0ABM1BRI8_LIMPO|nr:UPF0389 protein CG9231-like [Limulus polyphemus]XP_022255549.1 UPF0389 protein CG9231-like [Limulus polyphemus]
MAHSIQRLGISMSGLSKMINRGYQRPLTLVRTTTSASKAETPVSSEHELTYHRPNSFEKRLLVWFRKYPSYVEVPDFIPQNVMERVRNKARIRLNIYFCILAAIGCFAMVVSGKKAHNRGESMRKINEEFHEKHAHKN